MREVVVLQLYFTGIAEDKLLEAEKMKQPKN
jgi:hypothetical protein